MSRLVARLFGEVAKGFMAKRVDAWSSRMQETFMMDDAFRTSWHADEQRKRLKTASKYQVAHRAEEETSVSLVALPILLAMLATSAHATTLIGKNTPDCRATSLLVAVLASLPSTLDWSMESYPSGTTITCKGSRCDLRAIGGGTNRSAAHAWAHLVRLAGGSAPESTCLATLVVLAARAIAVEKHTPVFKTTCKRILHAAVVAIHAVLSLTLDNILDSDVTGVPLVPVDSRPVRVDAAIRAQVASASAGVRHGGSWAKGFKRGLLSRRRLAGSRPEHILHTDTVAGFGLQEMARYWLASRDCAMSGSLSISFDGVDIGRCKMMSLCCRAADSGTAFWMPPQVELQAHAIPFSCASARTKNLQTTSIKV
eukprot:6490569-Amphidinium_carterae.6